MTTKDQIYLRTKGVLPIQKIKLLAQIGVIKTPKEFPLEEGQFQPNSLDLRLGTIAHRVRCSFLPENETVDEKLAKLTQHSFSIDEGAVLEPNCTYIIPLLEEIDFPDNFNDSNCGFGILQMARIPCGEMVSLIAFITASVTSSHLNFAKSI